MTRKRIAIACQGGGSQCAFVAGALKTLFAHGVQERFEIVGFSGTSGGAITAALAWVGLLKRAQGDRTPLEDRIIALLEGSHRADAAGDRASTRSASRLLRLIERGLLPSFASSPSSPQFQLWSQGGVDADRRARSSPICGRCSSSTSTSTRCRRWSSPTARCSWSARPT